MCEKTVFFGAGAESMFDVSGGKDFAKRVLGINTSQMDQAISEFYKKLNLSNEWYPDYYLKKWEEKDLLKAAVKKAVLDKAIKFDKKKDYEQEVENRIALLSSGNESEKNNIIDKYTSYMGLLDERFHTLIAPQALGPYKFWSVVTCYTRAYLSIIAEILYGTGAEDVQTDTYIDMLNDPQKTMCKVREACKYDKRFAKECYYDFLQNRSDISVVTSNYTPLCEIKSDMSKDKIAYVHGRLGLFESPFEWRVYDAESDTLPNDQLLFPYLFIQSGVKPIVESTQVNELSKMLDFFRKSEKIIVVGYRINADDNHLNGFFRKMIIDGKEFIFLDFENDEAAVYRRLHLQKGCANLTWKPIDQDNCFEIFKGCIPKFV